jgi:HEPN domain-containing protein
MHMAGKPQEWLEQADYDMATAEAMLSAGRYFYAVFMCHLSLEKALKGVLEQRSGQTPPRIHSLVQLLNKAGAVPPENIGRFLVSISEANVPTRYPESLEKVQKEFTDGKARDIVSKGREALEWIRTLL